MPRLKCTCGRWLHSGVIRAGALLTPCRHCGVLVTFRRQGPTWTEKPRRVGTAQQRRLSRRPLSDGELMWAMEERWQSLVAASRWTRATDATSHRFAVFDRDGFRCRYCGRDPSDGVLLEVDHVIARANGGDDSLDNLVTACGPCNREKSKRPLTSPVPAS
jgi:5-methylcytosine-specific restriction endonuclease McrA